MTGSNKSLKVRKEKKPWNRVFFPQANGILLLQVLTVASITLVNCGDSYDKSPLPKPPIDTTHIPRPLDAVIPADAVTSSTPDLRFDSGFVSSSQCTLFLHMKYCNGVIRIRLGEQPKVYSRRDSLSKPPYCSDSTWIYNKVSYVYDSLKPKTTYYFNIYGTWGTSTNPPWIMDGIFTTRTDSSLNSLSTTVP